MLDSEFRKLLASWPQLLRQAAKALSRYRVTRCGPVTKNRMPKAARSADTTAAWIRN